MKEGGTREEDSDLIAMARLARGDEEALDELMARWTPRLGNYLQRFTGSEADAMDLLQETFLAVYRARERYRPSARFSTWVFGIARNLARQKWRWRRRHPEVAWDAEQQQADPRWLSEETPYSELKAAERAAEVRQAVLSLPSLLREAIILSEYEDLPHAEIARILRCSPKAVETRIYRAKKVLREKLRAE